MRMTKEQIKKETEERNKLMDLGLHEQVELSCFLNAIRVTTGWLYVTTSGAVTFVPETLPSTGINHHIR